MLVKNTNKLDEQIVRTLAHYPGITVEDLHLRICRKGNVVTKRAVFKGIRRLLDAKVTIKVGNCYSLRLSWAVELRNFADEIFNNYRKKSLFYSIIPPNSPPLTWHFPDPPLADDFWRQVALSLFEQSGKKNMFYWIKHAWFQLPSVEEELKFQDVLRSRGNKIYIIVEGNTYLDRLECRNWPSDPYAVSSAPSPFYDAGWGSLSVIGEYIVTVSITRFIRNKIDELFSKIKGSRDINLTEINWLLQLKGRCSLKLEHNPEKARKLKLQFARYFGVRAEDF